MSPKATGLDRGDLSVGFSTRGCCAPGSLHRCLRRRPALTVVISTSGSLRRGGGSPSRRASSSPKATGLDRAERGCRVLSFGRWRTRGPAPSRCPEGGLGRVASGGGRVSRGCDTRPRGWRGRPHVERVQNPPGSVFLHFENLVFDHGFRCSKRGRVFIGSIGNYHRIQNHFIDDSRLEISSQKHNVAERGGDITGARTHDAAHRLCESSRNPTSPKFIRGSTPFPEQLGGL